MRLSLSRSLRLAVASTLAAGSLIACTTSGVGRDTRLYDELGGQAGIDRLVEGMLIEVAADERIAGAFAQTNIARLRKLLAEQFCELSDGPCTYSGFSMPESHRGMRVTEIEFNALVESLVAAMEAQALPVPVQNRLLARLAPMQAEIVYR